MKITCGDKAKIITLAKSGKDANTIMVRFRRYSRQQIAAIMAWITMGKY